MAFFHVTLHAPAAFFTASRCKRSRTTTTQASTAPGMDISSGNCRTGGGHARDENPAQTESSKRIAEKGSEMAGLRSAASPAAFHEEAKEAEECAAHPVTHRRAAEPGAHIDKEQHAGHHHVSGDQRPAPQCVVRRFRSQHTAHIPLSELRRVPGSLHGVAIGHPADDGGAESGQHADVGADHTAADHQPPVLQGVAHAEHEPAASIGRPAAPHTPPMAEDVNAAPSARVASPRFAIG